MSTTTMMTVAEADATAKAASWNEFRGLCKNNGVKCVGKRDEIHPKLVSAMSTPAASQASQSSQSASPIEAEVVTSKPVQAEKVTIQIQTDPEVKAIEETKATKPSLPSAKNYALDFVMEHPGNGKKYVTYMCKSTRTNKNGEKTVTEYQSWKLVKGQSKKTEEPKTKGLPPAKDVAIGTVQTHSVNGLKYVCYMCNSKRTDKEGKEVFVEFQSWKLVKGQNAKET